MPRGRQAAIDRAPTIEEIQKIIEYPDRRIKPIVYTMVKRRVDNSHNASFKGHEDVVKHVGVVIEKTLAELKKLKKQNILPENEIMSPDQRHIDIRNNEDQTEINNVTMQMDGYPLLDLAH
jgi:hypothetical protein